MEDAYNEPTDKPKKPKLHPPQSPGELAKRLRARADNELLMAKHLNDGDVRVASIILHYIADVVEGQEEPEIAKPVIRKLAHV